MVLFGFILWMVYGFVYNSEFLLMALHTSDRAVVHSVDHGHPEADLESRAILANSMDHGCQCAAPLRKLGPSKSMWPEYLIGAEYLAASRTKSIEIRIYESKY